MRREYKYLVPNHLLPYLRNRLRGYVLEDDHVQATGQRSYTVRSIYMDTRNLSEYYKKLSGTYSRVKVRIRGYNQPDEKSMVFLELKRKRDMCISKDRAPVNFSNLESLLVTRDVERWIHQRSDFPYALDHARHFLYYLKRGNMQPVVLVTYEREAFIGRFDHQERITFDQSLRCIGQPRYEDLYQDCETQPVLSNHFILEVKTNNEFPRWMSPIISDLGLRYQALSKYTMSMDARHKLKLPDHTIWTQAPMLKSGICLTG